MTTNMSEITKGLEATWKAIGRRHTDLPPAVITTAPRGLDDGGTTIIGDDGTCSLAIGTDRLAQGGLATFRTLAHHAVHALAHVHDETDVSEEGRYHNARFVSNAREIGLGVGRRHPRYGFNEVTVPEQMAETYARQVAKLDELLHDYRPTPARVDRRRSQDRVKAVCGCHPERPVWMAESVLMLGPVYCGVCQKEFLHPIGTIQKSRRKVT